jgi:copper chaperone CopZ
MATMTGADPSSPASTTNPTTTKQLGARRPSSAPTTTAAAAAIGMVALAVLLVRKGRISKGRLLELAAAAVGGLLSSSCCTIQLVLNSLSLGCAGFAVLDTFRPLFLALTFSSLAYKTWRYDIRVHRNPLRSLPTWLIAAALASSPAVVRAINRRRGLAALASLEEETQLELAKKQSQHGPLKFRVTGMKCEACGNGLRNALEAMDGGGGKVKADVLFEEGVIYIERDGAAGGDDEGLEAAVQNCVEEMGYVVERVLPASTRAAATAASELVLPPPQ